MCFFIYFCLSSSPHIKGTDFLSLILIAFLCVLAVWPLKCASQTLPFRFTHFLKFDISYAFFFNLHAPPPSLFFLFFIFFPLQFIS